MAKRDNHYEAAFEAFLRARQAPYMAVDETRRSLARHRSLKNLDFLVSPPRGADPAGGSWLVDVKGRRFPSGKGKHYWKNWTTRDELRSLATWEEILGRPAAGLLVFAYNIVGDQAPLPLEELFVFRGGLYGFVAIRLDLYSSVCRPLSVKWDTVFVPTAQFRALACGIDALFAQQAARSEGNASLVREPS